MASGDRLLTRREYLAMANAIQGVPTMLIAEAISSVALEHPEWNMDTVKMTFQEWHERDNF